MKEQTMKRIAQLGFLLIAATTLMQSCKKTADTTETPVVKVQVEKAAMGSITQTVEADTVLVPQAQSAIVPKISSPIKKFMVQRGSHVHEGQVLAVLENGDLVAAVADSRGSFSQAEAAYNTTSKAQVIEDLQQAQLNVDQTRAALEVQKAQTDARANLLQQGAIPRRDYETSRSALVQARAAYDIAAQHLMSLERVSQQATLQNAQGGLASAKGKLQSAEASLSYATIRSPIDGVVTERPLFAGEMAQAGQPLLTVMDTSVLLAKVHLPQDNVAGLQLNNKATVSVQGTDQKVEGEISLISPALDAGSTTIEVWVKISNKQVALKPGTPVHVLIEAKTINNIVTVPTESVITTKTGGSAVLVVGSDNIAHEREIKPGVSDGKDTQAIEGIHPGEAIVTTGAHSLEDGTKVEVVGAEGDDEKAGDKKSSAEDKQ